MKRVKFLVSGIVIVIILITLILFFNAIRTDNKYVEKKLSDGIDFLTAGCVFQESNASGVYLVTLQKELLGIVDKNQICKLSSYANGNYSVEEISLNEQLIDSVDKLVYSMIDEDNNLLILFKYMENYYFYKINKNGETVLKINLNSNYYYKSFYIDMSQIYFLTREKQNTNFILEKYTIETGSYIDSISIKGYSNMVMSDGKMYSIKNNFIFVFDLNGEIISKIKLPDESEDTDMYYSNNGNLYYLNKNGVYVSEDCKKKFKLLLNSKDSSSFSYEVKNFFVDKNENIYIFPTYDPVDGPYPVYTYFYKKMD